MKTTLACVFLTLAFLSAAGPAAMRAAGLLASRPTTEQQAPVPPDHFFDSNGVRLRYVKEGQGPPVVLITATPATSSDIGSILVSSPTSPKTTQ
jgi:hypothetical protein